MNWHKKSILFAWVGLLSPAVSFASSGTEGASFLDIPVGARPAAMGGAYSALATDLYAAAWNPAGLGRLLRSQVGGMHLSYLEDTSYEHLGAAIPLASGIQGIGLSVQYFRPGDLVGRDETGLETSSFSGSYASYGIGYGATISDRLSIGVTGKWIRAQIDDVSASTFGGDVGLLAKPSESISLAFVAANLGKELKFLQEGDPLPTAYRLGAAWQPNSMYTLSMEGVRRKSGLTSAHAGMEFTAQNIFSLRGGYSTERIKELSAIAGASIGIGLKFWGQRIDYAFVPVSELGQTHYFSVIFQWGKGLLDPIDESGNEKLDMHSSKDGDEFLLIQQGADRSSEILNEEATKAAPPAPKPQKMILIDPDETTPPRKESVPPTNGMVLINDAN